MMWAKSPTTYRAMLNVIQGSHRDRWNQFCLIPAITGNTQFDFCMDTLPQSNRSHGTRRAAALWPASALTELSSHIAKDWMMYNSCRSNQLL